MKAAFFIRLFAGLIIAGGVSYWFATAPFVDANSEQLELSTPITLGQRSDDILQTPAENKPKPLIKTSITQKAELLWGAALPLTYQGDGTVENVRLAAEAIDLTVLHPGEIFSFNQTVGRRSEKKGYQQGPMYADGKVVMGIGGGICIASTVLYNAALETGLEIIERSHHSGPVSYAPPGRDAAVAYGCADLRFKNNTDSPILIRAAIKKDNLLVALFGKKQPGRTVEIIATDFEAIPYKIFEKEDIEVSEGEVVVDQKAQPGYSVTIIRLIKQNGKQISREIISHDVMPPRNKIMRIPPRPEELTEPEKTETLPDLRYDEEMMKPLPLPNQIDIPSQPKPASESPVETDSVQ